MEKHMSKEGVLILENGFEFTGRLFGAQSTRSINTDRGYGEVVFNTSMTGYQEILTDSSYYGQIICMTAPHIGNTGINNEDVENNGPCCAGFVIHDLCKIPSNWRMTGTLEDYLLKHDIPCLFDVDTRHLTRQLRSKGVIRGIIMPLENRHRAHDLLASLPRFEGRDMISEVSTKEPYKWPSQGKALFKVVAMDFGIKRNMLRCLAQRGCEITVVPAASKASDILGMKPDGIFLSNGPGDPTAAPYAADTVREILGKIPLFGVCMGHQILALAIGAKTYKLKFGHRGGNQPVIDKISGRVEISSHNHGYAVLAASLPDFAEITHVNLNDKTVEGIMLRDANAFSVQYHPEASPGPHDSMDLFGRFVYAMKQKTCTQNT